MGLVTEAIKRMFSRNTTNAASQSGARVPIVNVNGDPIGNDSLANFKSVLGGITTSLTNQNDLNDVVSSGVYSWSGSGTAPLNNFKPQGSLLLVWKTGTQIFQVQWPNTFNQSSVGIGFRLRWNNEWSAWYKILLSLDQ